MARVDNVVDLYPSCFKSVDHGEVNSKAAVQFLIAIRLSWCNEYVLWHIYMNGRYVLMSFSTF